MSPKSDGLGAIGSYIDLFVRGLHEAAGKIDWTWEELADALWLAALTSRAKATSPPSPESKGPQPEDQPPDPPPPSPRQPVEPRASSPTAKPPQTGSTTTPTSGSATVYESRSPIEAGGGPGRVKAAGVPFRSPAAHALSDPLDLTRALRPFKLREPSRYERVFDEEATVSRIAEQGLWIPVLRPAWSRKLDIAVVIEATPSMAVWAQDIREFRLLLEQLGAFRDVRIWYLRAGPAGVPLALETARGRGGHRPEEIVDPAGNRVVLMFSDCVGQAWRDGRIPALLETWGRSAPVALVQVLPRRLWLQSGLGVVPPLTVLAPRIGANNASLRVQGGPVDSGHQTGPVPVLEIDPESLHDWARLVTRGGLVEIAAFLPRARLQPRLGPVRKPESTARNRWSHFRSISSPTAVRLAGLLAASPSLRLPVMRLVQRSLLPNSGRAHLAEVVLGGLLHRVGGDAVTDQDALEFQFHAGLRELILDLVPVPDLAQVLKTVGRYIGERIGQSVDFPALLDDPAGLVEGLRMAGQGVAFATIATDLLRRLGGEYREIANQLDRTLEPPRSSPSPTIGLPPGVELETVLPGDRGEIFRLAWSLPDGAILAMPTRDGQVLFWEQKDVPPRRLKVSDFGVNEVAWAPDGRRFATASFDHLVRIWSYPQCSLISRLKDHNSDVHAVAWSPDGALLATGTQGGSARIWDTASWTRLQNVRLEVGPVYALAWSPDGSRLAVATRNNQIGICSRRGEVLTTLTIPGEPGRVTSLAWTALPLTRSALSESLIVGTNSGSLTIWPEPQSQGGPSHNIPAHDATIQGLGIDPTGNVVATKSQDGTVKLWQTQTWECLGVIDEPASRYAGVGIAFHPRRPLLATRADEDRSVRPWRLEHARLRIVERAAVRPRRVATLYHDQLVHRFSWSPDGRTLAVPSVDGTVSRWDWETDNASPRQLKTPVSRGGINQVAWSPDGRLLAAACFQGKVRIDEERSRHFDLPDLGGDVTSVAFSVDGTMLAAGTMVGLVWIWETSSWQQLRTLACGTAVWDLAWHPRRGLAVGGSDKLLVFDSEFSVMREISDFTSCIAWTADGLRLISGNWKGELQVLDGLTLEPLHRLAIHDGRITDLSFSHGDRLLATKSEDGTVRLWRLNPWEQVVEIRETNETSPPYASVAFHPVWPRLATRGPDGRTVRIWSLPPSLWPDDVDAPSALLSPPSRWVLVAGTGSYQLSPAVFSAADAVGRLLGEMGCGLITGGWSGVDHVAARSFCDVLQAQGGWPEDFLRHVLVDREVPDFPKGRWERVTSGEDIDAQSVTLADAVILIGGLGYTKEIGRLALEAHKPVLPLAATGGDAADLYTEIGHRLDEWWPRELGRGPFERIGTPESAAIEAVEVCLRELFGVPPRTTSEPLPDSNLVEGMAGTDRFVRPDSPGTESTPTLEGLVTANGVDALTGGYSLPPQPPEVITAIPRSRFGFDRPGAPGTAEASGVADQSSHDMTEE